MKRTVLCGMLLALPLAMNASTLNWDFTASGGAGTLGNVVNLSSGGVNVTVTAFSLANQVSTTQFTAAAVGQWGSYGLGVCNAAEYTGCSSPNHQVDNIGGYDFLLLQFSAPVDPISLVIRSATSSDRDLTYWTGNQASGYSLLGLTLANIGLGSATTVNNPIGSGAITVSLGNPSMVNTLLVGTALPNPDGWPDYFKLQSVSVGQVPEPATYALLGIGLVALGTWKRFRRG